MTQNPPAHDETVRMPADGAVGRPQPDGRRPGLATMPHTRADATADQEPDGEPDDTRPVTRDWLRGAPGSDSSSAPAAGDRPDEPSAAGTGDDSPEHGTRQIDGTDPAPAPPDAPSSPAAAYS